MITMAIVVMIMRIMMTTSSTDERSQRLKGVGQRLGRYFIFFMPRRLMKEITDWKGWVKTGEGDYEHIRKKGAK